MALIRSQLVRSQKEKVSYQSLGNQRGIALMGIVLTISIVIAFLFISGLKYASRMADTRGQTRRQLYSQEIFQNASVIVHDAYETARGVSFGTCPAPTVKRTTTSGVTLCLPPTTTPAVNCIANPEMASNYICLDTAASGNGVLTFAPILKPSLVARAIDKLEIFSNRISFGAGLSSAQAEVSQLPTIPAFTPISYAGAAPLGLTCNAAFICVTIRICLQASNCPLASASTDDLNFYQMVGFPP